VSLSQYFNSATPGEYNTSGMLDVVADTKFSRNRGFYDVPFSVTITTETDGATIRYTTDGSIPSETNGNNYAGPISINTTTCLRARAFKAGWMATNIDTQTYIFLDDVITQPANPPGFPTSWNGTTADYEMDPEVVNDSRYRDLMKDSLMSLPSVSIVADVDSLFGPSGIYSNPLGEGVTWERPVSVEWINPDGTTAFQVDCGLRIYGGAFRRMDLTRKKTFRFLFKRDYGPSKLRYPLFGEDATDEFDTIILRAGANDGWNNWGGENTQYIIDEFMRRTQLALGQPSGHGTFVHLYVNGLYWGLYNPVERPEQSFASTYFGGDKETWDTLNAGAPVGESGTATWGAMMSIARSGMTTNEAYQRIQGNNPDGTNNPAYDDLLDVGNYIDYLFSNFWGGTGDWGGRNWYASCRRPPNATGFKFFNWDSEGAIVIWSNLTADVTGAAGTVQEAYSYIRQNSEFCMLFADHAHRHLFNEGPGAVQNSYNRYKELSDLVELGIIAESARWGDQATASPYTQANWQNMRDYILNTYMPQRPNIMFGHLKGAGLYPQLDAPVIHINEHYQNGGEIQPTDEVSMILSEDVYYIEEELVAEGAAVRAHVPIDNRLGETWTARGFVPDTNWTSGTSGTGVGYENGDGYENWINTDVGAWMIDRSTSVFARIEFNWDGSEEFDKLELQMRYDDGFIAYINGERVYKSVNVTNEIPGTATAQGHEAVEAYEKFDISGHIDDLEVGTNVLAIHGINITTGSSDMIILPRLIGKTIDEAPLTRPVLYTMDGSDPRLPGGGVNPAAIEYANEPFTLSQSSKIRTRTFYSDQWSALNEVTFGVGPVADSLRITEMMFHPLYTGDANDPNKEYIELQNVGGQTINLNMVRFTNGVDFEFPGMTLAPGEHLLVVRDLAAFEAEYPGFSGVIAGQYSGSLNNGGERVELVDATGRSILNFRYGDDWRSIADGGGFSLTIIDPHHPDPNSWGLKDSWRASAYAGGSPGSDDSGILPNPGDIAINEVLAHAHAEAPDWIELYNASGDEINIGGWYLSDSLADLRKYRIADGLTIGSGEYLMFYEDANFGEFSADPGRITGFALNENGDSVYLTSAEGSTLLGYREAEDFGASPRGISFGRYFKRSTNNYNFVLMDHNTPASANSYPKVGPVVISEIMYNPLYAEQEKEYVELYNSGDTAVTLYDSNEQEPWRFTSGIDYTFPDYPGLTIPAGWYVLIVKDIAVYLDEYGPPPSNSLLLGPYNGSLSNGGEKLDLSMPGEKDEYDVRHYIRIERINYSDGSHHEDAPGGIDQWPMEADGKSKSLTRVLMSGYGNDPNNWTAAEPSPGEPAAD
ncbi:MAG: lamin tail domain-containing protein, partial [Sedimentisphaerales bacterium]|nr:lamin tail domain-containing protein [Sedimentisphaerales bacterium]